MFGGKIYNAVMAELKKRVKEKQEEYEQRVAVINTRVINEIKEMYSNAEAEKEGIAKQMVSELLGK